MRPAAQSNGTAPPVCLWQENLTGLVSLWDLARFYGEQLAHAIAELSRLRTRWANEPARGDPMFASMLSQHRSLNSSETDELFKQMSGIEAELRQAGLMNSAVAVQEFCQELGIAAGRYYSLATWRSIETPAQGIAARIEEIQRAVRRDLKAIPYLYVPLERSDWYNNPLRDWDAVVQRWPKMTSDISDSSQCYALDLLAASLYHVLLVGEFGVIQVSDLFGVSGDKPGWGSAERLEKILNKDFKQRSDLEKRHSAFLESIVPMIITMKDSMRHQVMHVDN